VEASQIRANFESTNDVEVRDPFGDVWTVSLVRPDEPRNPLSSASGGYHVVRFLRSVSRKLHRDHRWNVELMRGRTAPDRRRATICATLPDRDAAADRAVLVAAGVEAGARGQKGDVSPDQPGMPQVAGPECPLPDGRRVRKAGRVPGRDQTGYPSPEAAALSSFSPSARARVVRVEVHDDDHVDVIVDTEPTHLMRCFTRRADGEWYDEGDSAE
jgi:hypothetical protein